MRVQNGAKITDIELPAVPARRPGPGAPRRGRSPARRAAAAAPGIRGRKTVQATVGPDAYQVSVESGITVTPPGTASSDIRRHKASNHNPEVPPDLA
jgi:hypothetical protein